MKRRVIVGFVFFLLSVSCLMAQDIPDGVVKAFERGNASELEIYMSDQVNVSILNGAVYSKRVEAVKALETFFSENKIYKFLLNHKGKRNESGFIIGTLVSVKKEEFRVNCFFKKVHKHYYIYQIRIDKTNE
ncbi:MAG: DUF4783 domain-containing protein [Bacteroidaceae bacterium]|nr:DUF4783 domain-containing protein [Bacteroidaceae bacterium]